MWGRTSVFDYLDAIQTVLCKILLSRSPVGRCQLFVFVVLYLLGDSCFCVDRKCISCQHDHTKCLCCCSFPLLQKLRVLGEHAIRITL
jgi:hypothetical protein